jgi:integrase
MAGFTEPTKFTWETYTENGEEKRRKKPKRGTKWKARYRDPQGRPRSRTFDTKVEAERFLENNGADINRGDWINPTLGRQTFDDWARLWFESTSRLAPRTQQGYHQILVLYVLPWFTGRAIASIDWADVDSWLSQLVKSGRIGDKKLSDALSVMSLIMKHAIKGRARKDNPALDHRLNKRKRKLGPEDIYSADEIKAIVEHTRDPYKTAILLFVFAALRPSELAGLLVRNLDFVNHDLYVRQGFHRIPRYGDTPRKYLYRDPKSPAGFRKVPLPDWLCEAIAQMLAERAAERGTPIDPMEPLYLNAIGKPYPGDGFRDHVFYPAVSAAGLRRIRLYSLRHSAASLAIESGASVLAVAERLGHAEPSVTLNVYGHLFPGAQRKLTAALDARMEEAEPAAEAKVVGLHEGPRRTRSGRAGRAKDAK